MHDYDGFVRNWNNFGLIPPNYKEFIDFIEARVDGRDIIELGSGNGLVSAALAENYNVLAVDVHEPIAQGSFVFMKMDGNNEEFFTAINSSDHPAVVGRRSFCLFYHNPEWIKRLTATKAEMLLIQSLDGDKGYFVNNPQVEAIYLERNGWKAEVDGRFVCATR